MFFKVLSGAFLCVMMATATVAAEESCKASWYGPGFNGKRMANGAIFNENNPNVVAHKSHPFGTVLEITNLNNGRSLRATVTDRGPFIAGRCVDLSKAGAIALDYKNRGTTSVSVRVVN
jgi:rare lipoprotein A